MSAISQKNLECDIYPFFCAPEIIPLKMLLLSEQLYENRSSWELFRIVGTGDAFIYAMVQHADLYLIGSSSSVKIDTREK